MRLAIIPARGGSRRIPEKNLRLFCGQPIIKYSIESALSSGCFDEVMVSTDNERIAEIALKYGAKVPFIRSAKNSSDSATTIDVLWEVLNEYNLRGQNWEHFCCLYPTAPFSKSHLLIEGLRILLENQEVVRSVFPIVRYSHPIQRAMRIRDGLIDFFSPENNQTRTQDLEASYHDAGQFYWLNTQRFLESKKIFGPDAIGMVVPELEVQDIDNESDWTIAELKFRLMQKKWG